jgi:hypothetical protein
MATDTTLRLLSVSTLGAFLSIEDDTAALAAALAGLAHTSEVRLPVKLVLDRRAGQPRLLVEAIDGYGEPDLLHATDALYQYRLREKPARGGPGFALRAQQPASPFHTFATALANALGAADWTIPPASKAGDLATTPLRVAPPWAATSFVTIAPVAAGFVRVALGIDVLRAKHETARAAVGLLALQASARLVLARPTLGSTTARDEHDDDKLTLGWDAVVPANDSQPVERAVATIAHAAAACDVARRLTLESFRALAQSAELADAYFASDSRFENFRSIGAGKAPAVTTAQTNREENDACRPQPQL